METLADSWSGSIEVPGQPLNIVVEFANDEELTGTISIPVQGLQNYPLSIINVEEESIFFTMEIQGQSISFDGKVDEETITGDFKQNGQTFPFELTKGAATSEPEEDGEFLEVETEIGTLYGEVEMPDGNGPFPVMLIIPGSGPTDRNGNSPGARNDSLKFVAEELAANGVASLRYDKRGAGENRKAIIAEEELQFEQFIDDAVTWVELLKEEENFTEVGIIGHSQGSLVGMLAARDTEVDTFISLAGAGRSIDEVLHDQLREQLPGDLMKESEEILQQLKEGKVVENVSEELQSAFRPSVQPFISSWMQYEPTEEIAKLDIPTLVINGKNDLQVSPDEAEMLQEAKEDAVLVLIDKMNHVLKEAPGDEEGNLQTYNDPDLPLADGLIDALVEFLNS
ncbi:alpha/beta hydrolase [Virgibacillus ainsalahensis]